MRLPDERAEAGLHNDEIALRQARRTAYTKRDGYNFRKTGNSIRPIPDAVESRCNAGNSARRQRRSAMEVIAGQWSGVTPTLKDRRNQTYRPRERCSQSCWLMLASTPRGFRRPDRA